MRKGKEKKLVKKIYRYALVEYMILTQKISLNLPRKHSVPKSVMRKENIYGLVNYVSIC